MWNNCPVHKVVDGRRGQKSVNSHSYGAQDRHSRQHGSCCGCTRQHSRHSRQHGSWCGCLCCMNVVSHPQLIMTKRPTCKKRIPWRIPAVGTAFAHLSVHICLCTSVSTHRCAHRYTACRLGRAPRNTSDKLPSEPPHG